MAMDLERGYFQQLSKQVKRVLDKNRTLAKNVQEAHQWLRQISACLHYPRKSHADDAISSSQVAKEMKELLDRFQPNPKYQRPQSAIKSKLQRNWNLYGADLLHTYDIPGLPPDNLQIESLFGRLRRHQRRVSGRKSTRPLREFGHYQVLFSADSQADLLNHLRSVPLHEYRKHRKMLEAAEISRHFMHCLHRDPEATLRRLVNTYTKRTITHHTHCM
jgi:muconolactone delta-isomerase